MVIKKVDPMSLAKFSGTYGALVGFIVGALSSFFMSMAGSLMSEGRGMAGGFGIAAIIIVPLIYGIVGFLGGGLSALIFNLIAKITGGLKIETE